MNLTYTIQHQTCTRTDRHIVVANSRQYLYIDAVFSRDWDRAAISCILYASGGHEPLEAVKKDGCWLVPQSLIRPEGFYLSFAGACADGTMITTDKQYVQVKDSGYLSGAMPEDREPTKYEALMREIKTVQEAGETAAKTVSEGVKAAQAAKEEIKALHSEVTDAVEGMAPEVSALRGEMDILKGERETQGSVLNRASGLILEDEMVTELIKKAVELGLIGGSTEPETPVVHPYTSEPWNDGWRFSKDGTNWETVTLPHTCNAADGMSASMYRGISYYEKSLVKSRADFGKSIFLVFAGAGQKSRLLVNGEEIMKYPGGYTPFAADLTYRLKIGTNTVRIECDNTADIDLIPVSADFNFNNGLHREVYLAKRSCIALDTAAYGMDRFHVTQESVTDSTAVLSYDAKLINEGAQALSCTVTALLKDGDGVVKQQAQEISVPGTGVYDYHASLTIPSPHLWDALADPFLYRSEITVRCGGETVDQAQTKTGLRYVSLDPDEGFFLNGKAYPLRGAALHQDAPKVMSAMTKADFDRDYEIVCDIGCNFVRLAHYPHSRYAFEKCDELGLVVQTEIPWVNHLGKNASSNYHDSVKENLKSMILNYYNHPSIVFWGLSNELNGSHWAGGGDPQGGFDAAKAVAWNNEFYAQAKAMDAKRLIGFTSHDNTFYGSSVTDWDADFIASNQYKGWYGSTFSEFGRTMDRYNTKRSGWAVGEYGAGANTAHHSDTPMTTTNTGSGGKRHDEEYANLFHESYLEQIQARPYLVYTSIWALFDFAVAGRNEGGLPYLNDKGLVTRDRMVKKDPYYLYKAAWSSEDVVYITSRRFTERSTEAISIKVYSNCDKLELYVDDVLKQTMTSATKMGLVWEFDAVAFSQRQHTFTVEGYRNQALTATDAVEFSTAVFEGSLDLTELTALIEACETDFSGVVRSEDGYDVMSDAYWVTPSAYTAFETALAEARNVLDTAVTQSQADNAVTALNAAQQTYLTAKQPGKIADSAFDIGNNIAYVPLNHVNENTTLYAVFEDGLEYYAGGSKLLLSSKSPDNTSGTSGISMVISEGGSSLISFHTDTVKETQTGVARQYVLNEFTSLGISRPTFNSLQTIIYRAQRGFECLANQPIGTTAGWITGYTEANTGTVQPFNGYLYINVGDKTPAAASKPEAFRTSQALTAAVEEGIFTPNYSKFKIKRLMVWEDTRLTGISEILATDVKPNIDMRVDTDGVWRNIGTNGEAVYSSKR